MRGQKEGVGAAKGTRFKGRKGKGEKHLVEAAGRRAAFLSTSQSFTLSSGNGNAGGGGFLI